MSRKKEFGDFQTPASLAAEAVALVDRIYGTPELVVEPTAGLGTFLSAAADQWGAGSRYEGYEINNDYVAQASAALNGRGARVYHRDFFSENWRATLSRTERGRVLVIGNPPWVTNSDLGQLGSQNLPAKTNFQGLRGFDARTGKSNFDIAEWMLIRLIESLPPDGLIAMLCKTMTARKVLRHFWKTDGALEGACLFSIDARKAFDVAVDACFFVVRGRRSGTRGATVYAGLDLETPVRKFGLVDGDLVSDIEAYERHRNLDGGTSAYTWRSGVKHDAAQVMEFTRIGKHFQNGLGETVDLEERYLFPLLKSSDVGNGRVRSRKHVLITQTHTGDDTSAIRSLAPNTWRYLERHRDILDGRKSSIYLKRPRFSIFGVGSYSFAPWKVAVSGLYKSFSFSVVPPVEGRPVMVDDTCYSISCQSEDEARLLRELLSSKAATEFLSSLVFTDSKRPITIDILRRISLVELARSLGKLRELEGFIRREGNRAEREHQMSLSMEPPGSYETSRARKRSLASG